MNDFKKQLFISGVDNLEDGVMQLRNQTWISLLRKEYGKIDDGMKIWLAVDAKNNGLRDPTIFSGIIRDVGVENEYEVLINEKDIKYLSESEEFKDYSIEDVLGSVKFNEEHKKIFPGLDRSE